MFQQVSFGLLNFIESQVSHHTMSIYNQIHTHNGFHDRRLGIGSDASHVHGASHLPTIFLGWTIENNNIGKQSFHSFA